MSRPESREFASGKQIVQLGILSLQSAEQKWQMPCRAGVLNRRTIVGESLAAEWRVYLTGLWFSGLRRQESLILSWNQHALFAVDMIGLLPWFKFSGKAKKSRKAQYLPMTQDFAEWLLRTFPLGRTVRTGLQHSVPSDTDCGQTDIGRSHHQPSE